MLDALSLPVICAANLCYCAKWFVHLKSLMNHPILKEEEKLLWLWLATCSANNQSLTCSLSYEQISLAINKPVRVIHRCLQRLKVMGLLLGDIPIWYGVPTPQMVNEVRKLKLVLIEREFVEVPIGVSLPKRQNEKREDKSPRSLKASPSLQKWVSLVRLRSPLKILMTLAP